MLHDRETHPGKAKRVAIERGSGPTAGGGETGPPRTKKQILPKKKKKEAAFGPASDRGEGANESRVG